MKKACHGATDQPILCIALMVLRLCLIVKETENMYSHW